MDNTESAVIIKKILNRKDGKRFDVLTSKLEDEAVPKEEFAKLNEELKTMLADNHIQLFAAY